jgi:adenine deaminase
MKGSNSFSITGQVVDLPGGRIFPGSVHVKNGRISAVKEEKHAKGPFILPGLIDAHIHVESSMLIPSEFARLAVVHGTVATVSDPHEIANVLGIEGILFMIRNGKRVPFKFFFGASSCVPATPFETAGATLGPAEIESLLAMDDVLYLSEMMNFPGVLNKDPEVLAKLNLARKYKKPVDGHAPGLRGEDAAKYIAAGISTDHECFQLGEALDKAAHGMHILIREGSAAKNFDELIPLLGQYPAQVMFCSDDRHPNDLAETHMNDLVRRAMAAGYDPITVLRACTLNPVRHYGLNVGLLQAGDPADFILVNTLESFEVIETYIEGELVARQGQSLIGSVKEQAINKFNTREIQTGDIEVKAGGSHLRVIEALDGQLVTLSADSPVAPGDEKIESDTGRDILKLVVYNRYSPAKPAVAFIKNFGLKRGAIASTVAHDSHNLIAVGSKDDDICQAINMLVRAKGGISLADGPEREVLPLPVAGLMSDEDGYRVAAAYDRLDKKARALGSSLRAPYMTLSFMALLVIPELKLSDKGLFDGKKFEFIPLTS